MSRILIVDDDEQIRRVLTRILEGRGHTCASAASSAEARSLLPESGFDLMLCDVKMPGESGLDLISDVRSMYSDIAVVMISVIDSPAVAEDAIDLGAYGYIVKPFDPVAVLINVASALRRRTLEQEARQRQSALEDALLDKSADLRRALEALDHREREFQAVLAEAEESTIYRLAATLEFRDRETSAHSIRMGEYARRLALDAGLPEQAADAIRVAAALHDLGKIGVPDRILFKPAALTEAEFAVIQRHPDIGCKILEGAEMEVLSTAAVIALTHHERFDGSGYPRGIGAEDIPLEGRIAAVADVFDALTSARPYRPPFELEHALDMMRAGRGSHFDPQVLDFFLAALDDVLLVRTRHPDRAEASVSTTT